ncbi:hypothetical protein BAE44_0016938 [Dichanthelium oligosanthes]|uniref:Uncharacterized protein n=1 Tax=Dichanthelium oligosanthes TaxID=888268 RepID=A0A1E5VAJ8_9POAL|nr:hypothetical protein BAE44_0016938 [Dichanthelium oligosanthes]
MSMEGLIPFVCGAMKRRKRAKKAVDYKRLSSSASAPPTLGQERFAGGAYYHSRSQSCRFAACSPADELGFSRDEGDRALPDEGLRHEPLQPAVGDGWPGPSRSRRFSSMRLFACVSGA